MPQSPMQLQNSLPPFVQLLRYGPNRRAYSWQDRNPATVRVPADLPPYLILGGLDGSSFRNSSDGWSARWRGLENDTYFDVTFKLDRAQYELRQVWQGLDGGFSIQCSTGSPGQAALKGFGIGLPQSWEKALKEQLEATYQLTVMERPEKVVSPIFDPDGVFYTIAFPVHVFEIRQISELFKEVVASTPFNYPVLVAARLLDQVVNYPEGKAPAWTREPMAVFAQSIDDTGLMPLGLPVRETAKSGSAAWTLRREIYFMFINLPFAGLADFLGRISDKCGPVRATTGQPLRFELRPIVIPGGFEVQVESVALFDNARTTRSFLQFLKPGGRPSMPTFEEVTHTLENSSALIQRAEHISNDVVEAFNQAVGRLANGHGPE